MLLRVLRALSLVLLTAAPAAAQLTDNFADGDFTQNPAWSGDVASFQVTTQQLQSNGPAVTGTQLQLVTPVQAVTGTTWEFWANLRLATSSGNLADVWLVSEQADLKASGNRGYFVRIGGTPDEVALFRKDATGSPAYVVNGVDGTIASSTNNLVRVRVTRTTAGLWTLERDLAGGRTFVSEGTATDNTYQRSQFLGVLLTYSSANNRNFYFDDFVVTDNTAPLLSEVTVASPNQLEVLFNEPVAASTTAGSFRLNSGAVATTAVRDATDPGLVRLTFASPLPTGNNTLEARNVADLYGNVAAGPLTASFTNNGLPVAPTYFQVLITEIYADETPAAGAPPATYASEFIEIYNPTASILDLSGVRLSRPSSTGAAAVFPAGALLQPGEYAVVCASTRASQFASFGKVFGLTNFPSLPSTGDQLLLRNRQGQALFEVTYSDAWYQDPVKKEGGWSLEMVDTGRPCADGQNWAASTHATGATPGRANSVATNNPDRTAPALLGVNVVGPTVLRLSFGEKLDSTLMGNTTLYSLQPALAVQRAAVLPYDFRTVELTLAAPLPVNQSYTVSVVRATDCAGNVAGLVASASFTYYGPAVPPGYNQLLITEILADEDPAVGLPRAEFVEIHNPTGQLLDLGGVRLLKPGSSSAAVFPGGATLRPGEYAIVCGSGNAALFAAFGRVFGLTSFPSLSNAGDQLLLRARDGRQIFEVSYADSWYRDNSKKDGGWTLEMVDTSNPCAGSDNWRASTDPSGGTPGRQNSVRAANPDRTAPTLLRAVAASPTVLRLTFAEKLDSAQTANPALYSLGSGGPAVTRVMPLLFDFRAVELTLASPLTPNQLYTLTVSRATDCVGNASGPLTSGTVVLPTVGAPGDVVINEILFNPRTDGVDFVELLNRSSKYIDLQGWQIGRVRPDSIAENRIIISEPYVLAPGQLAVLTSRPDVVQAQYPSSSDPAALLPALTLPTYADDAGVVTLLNNQGLRIDRFDYNQNMHLALLDTRDGVSLERLRPDGPSRGANFHSAAGSVGYATPGRRNSQFLADAVSNQQFTVEPEVFTPDDDGQQDYTTLRYNLDAAGYAASVTVYDAVGRLTRRLVRNESLATTGFIQWDGLTDSQHKAPVGYYVLHIELYKPGGGPKKEYKKTVVVGARF